MTRFLFLVNGLLALVVATRTALNESNLAAWRQSDAIWGKDALPFNVATLLAVGFGYLYAMVSSSTFERGTRLRLSAFILLDLLVQLSMGRLNLLLPVTMGLFFLGACAECDGSRRERKRATVPVA